MAGGNFIQFSNRKRVQSVCPRSLDPFYIVTILKNGSKLLVCPICILLQFLLKTIFETLSYTIILLNSQSSLKMAVSHQHYVKKKHEGQSYLVPRWWNHIFPGLPVPANLGISILNAAMRAVGFPDPDPTLWRTEYFGSDSFGEEMWVCIQNLTIYLRLNILYCPMPFSPYPTGEETFTQFFIDPNIVPEIL